MIGLALTGLIALRALDDPRWLLLAVIIYAATAVGIRKIPWRG